MAAPGGRRLTLVIRLTAGVFRFLASRLTGAIRFPASRLTGAIRFPASRLTGPVRWLVVGVALFAAAPASGQFRVETRVVLVDVSVTRNGPIAGLGEGDFELRVDGDPMPFRLLDPDSLPLATLFAMDVSASTAGERRRRLVAGARRFTEAMTERDVCGVVAFSMEARFVRDFAPCEAGVGEDLLARAPRGATAIRDGIVLSLAVLHARAERPVLLLFTDAQDNLSWVGEDHLRRSVRTSDALLYAIVAPPPRVSRSLRPDDAGPRLLRDLARATGGRVVTIRSDDGLEEAFEEVLGDLRVRYVLAFTPDPAKRGFVPIEVRVNRPRVSVRARAGYTAR